MDSKRNKVLQPSYATVLSFRSEVLQVPALEPDVVELEDTSGKRQLLSNAK